MPTDLKAEKEKKNAAPIEIFNLHKRTLKNFRLHIVWSKRIF